MSQKFRFLIVGAGRGGTSLLAGLLDQHSLMEVGFELYAAAFLRGKALSEPGGADFDRRATAFVQACARVADKSVRAVWGNKITTEQIQGLEGHNRIYPEARLNVLDRFFNGYLAGRSVVFILRDGRTCVDSKVRRTGQPMELACWRWQYSVDVLRFLRAHHPKHHWLRFEDLVRRPEDTLSGVCSFLGVPFEPPMLSGTDNPKMRAEYRRKGLDPAKIRPTELPADFLELIQPDLDYCGYL